MPHSKLEDIQEVGTRKSPEGFVRRPEGWQEVLAYAFAQFLLKKPRDLGEAIQRFAVISLLVFLSGGSYLVFKHPNVVDLLHPIPVVERSIVDRLAEDPTIKEKAFTELELWFYAHRPHGLMLVSWEQLHTLNGIWVSPPGKFKPKTGIHDLTDDIRQMAGPFVFDECVILPSDSMPGKMMAACPINTTYDVWGYVAVIYHPSELSNDYVMRDLKILAHRLTEIIY